jgi:hypothetical protein
MFLSTFTKRTAWLWGKSLLAAEPLIKRSSGADRADLPRYNATVDLQSGGNDSGAERCTSSGTGFSLYNQAWNNLV